MEAAFPRSRWGLCRRGPLASRWAALLLLLALTCTAVRSSPALEVSEGVASAAGNAATEEGAALASRRGLASVGRGRRRSWVSDMDKFLDGNKGISTRLRRKKQQRSIGGDSILSKYGGLFPCRWKPLNVPLPFQWFCHPADKDLSLEDPAGPVVLTRHGQVLGMGPHIYSFQPKIEGPARILYKGVEVGTFKARLDGCKCPLPFRTFTHEYGCGQQGENPQVVLGLGVFRENTIQIHAKLTSSVLKDHSPVQDQQGNKLQASSKNKRCVEKRNMRNQA